MILKADADAIFMGRDGDPVARTVPLEDLVIAASDDAPEVMHLLERGIPLTLLIDLLSPLGPRSADILATENAGAA